MVLIDFGQFSVGMRTQGAQPVALNNSNSNVYHPQQQVNAWRVLVWMIFFVFVVSLQPEGGAGGEKQPMHPLNIFEDSA